MPGNSVGDDGCSLSRISYAYGPTSWWKGPTTLATYSRLVHSRKSQLETFLPTALGGWHKNTAPCSPKSLAQMIPINKSHYTRCISFTLAARPLREMTFNKNVIQKMPTPKFFESFCFIFGFFGLAARRREHFKFQQSQWTGSFEMPEKWNWT